MEGAFNHIQTLNFELINQQNFGISSVGYLSLTYWNNHGAGIANNEKGF